MRLAELWEGVYAAPSLSFNQMKYKGKLLGSFYAENDSIELTASQRNDLNLLLREYKQRLNTLDERYREAFHAFRKFVCG